MMPLGEPFLPAEPEWVVEAQDPDIFPPIKKNIGDPKNHSPLPVGDTADLKVWHEYWKQHDANVIANNNKRFATILTAILQDIRSEAFEVKR